MFRDCILSECGRYRYRLSRRWAAGPTLLFIMLNPSTADAEVDDRTIRRCVAFAKAEGFCAIEVVNLYAYRATKPADLKRAGYPVGPDNDDHIEAAVRAASGVCLAWGANVAGLARPAVIQTKLRALGIKPMCLRITRSGYPEHPLMLPSACKLGPFTLEAIYEAMLSQDRSL